MRRKINRTKKSIKDGEREKGKTEEKNERRHKGKERLEKNGR